VPPERFTTLVCQLCKVKEVEGLGNFGKGKGVGAVVQCHYGRCMQAAHPACVLDPRHNKHGRFYPQEEKDNKQVCELYCAKHKGCVLNPELWALREKQMKATLHAKKRSLSMGDGDDVEADRNCRVGDMSSDDDEDDELPYGRVFEASQLGDKQKKPPAPKPKKPRLTRDDAIFGGVTAHTEAASMVVHTAVRPMARGKAQGPSQMLSDIAKNAVSNKPRPTGVGANFNRFTSVEEWLSGPEAIHEPASCAFGNIAADLRNMVPTAQLPNCPTSQYAPRLYPHPNPNPNSHSNLS